MTTTLYLVRHAPAEDAAPGGDDADRRLTAAGARRMRLAAAGLARAGVRPAVILTSPLIRAEETSSILAAALTPRIEPEVYTRLAGGPDPRDVVAGLHRHRAARTLCLVGHQPDLGRLASYLLTGDPDLVPLPFKKGGIAAIEVPGLPPQGRGVLRWFVTPKQLRAMAR